MAANSPDKDKLFSTPVNAFSSSASGDALCQRLHKNLPKEDLERPHNWQETRNTVKERLAYMFNSSHLADVHFIVGTGSEAVKIPAHKFVLSIGSAVFDAMFNGPMATKETEITLTDVEPSAFTALLKFLYTDEVSVDSESVMTTLYTAKKYAICSLEEHCIEFLKANICSANAFTLLSQARLFDEPALARMCLDTIEKNTYEAISAEGFEDIDRDTLIAVLGQDSLNIQERKLYTAVLRWADAECNRRGVKVNSAERRRVLDGVLHLIRFPLMTVEEFAALQYCKDSADRLLNDGELVDLFFYFSVTPKPSTRFISKPRSCHTGQEQVVSRFCQIEHRWGYSGASDKIKLCVNRNLFIVGFGLYGSVHGPADHRVNMQVIDVDRQLTVGETDACYRSDGSSSTYHVRFKERIEILAGVHYVCSVTIKGPDSYYGTKGLRKVTHESTAGDGKVTFNLSYATGNNNGTCVEDGQIPEILYYL